MDRLLMKLIGSCSDVVEAGRGCVGSGPLGGTLVHTNVRYCL